MAIYTPYEDKSNAFFFPNLEPIIKKYTKIIDGVPVEITEKETREERIITGSLNSIL